MAGIIVRPCFIYRAHACFNSRCICHTIFLAGLNQFAVGAFVCMIVHPWIIYRVFAAFVCQNNLLEFT